MKALLREVTREKHQWEVWIVIDLSNGFDDGYCVGVGETRAAAIVDAATDLQGVLDQLGELR